MKCKSCEKENRSQARFCRFCGTPLSDPTEAGSPLVLDGLLGLDAIKQDLQSMLQVLGNMQKDGIQRRLNYSMILSGNSGTAKTMIGSLFFNALKALGAVQKSRPQILEGSALDALEPEKIPDLLKDNRGGNAGGGQLP